MITTTSMPQVEVKFREPCTREVRSALVPAVWVGSGLAVHRPATLSPEGVVSLADKDWEISHLASGMRVVRTTQRRKAEQFARRWDERLQSLHDCTLKGMQAWPHFKALQQAVTELR